MKFKKSLLAIPAIFIVIAGLFYPYEKEKPETKPEDNTPSAVQMAIHYIDVGQGDSIFIELPNGKTMLIDAGEKEYGSKIKDYIGTLEYDTIDYLVGTHPHSDHIGGMAYIIENFNIGSIYMPKVISTTKTYENLLKTIAKKELTVKSAKAGVEILKEDNLQIDILAPNSDEYKNMNNYSAVIKITYGNRKFLFMGDSQTLSEKEITADIQADVLKVGHHGSNTSSSKTFLTRVNAEYAIISVGEDNSYKHPSAEAVERLQSAGLKIYRTDFHGTIVMKTNGTTLSVTTERG